MQVHVHASRIIPHPIAKIWPLLRNFNGLPDWHPMIARSQIEDDLCSDQVGAIRSFYTHAGDHIQETLLALDDHRHRVTYNILESHMGVSQYVADIQLLPITANPSQCLMVWTAEFDCASDRAEELARSIEWDVFQAGMKALEMLA